MDEPTRKVSRRGFFRRAGEFGAGGAAALAGVGVAEAQTRRRPETSPSAPRLESQPEVEQAREFAKSFAEMLRRFPQDEDRFNLEHWGKIQQAVRQHLINFAQAMGFEGDWDIDQQAIRSAQKFLRKQKMRAGGNQQEVRVCELAIETLETELPKILKARKAAAQGGIPDNIPKDI